MNFEDALKELRNGKKIRHPYFEKDEYLMACYVTINPLLCPEGIEPFQRVKARGMSITWMLGEFVHPKMKSKFSKFPPECEDELHRFPQLNLLLIMDDDWEVIE